MSESFEAVIVLANLMSRGGQLNRESRDRADLALEAYRSGRAGVIVPCGWAYRADSPISIGEAISRYLRRQGVAAHAILVEHRSRDTVGDAVFTKLELQFRRVLIATSDYHVPRATEVFRFVYGPDRTVEALGSATQSSSEKLHAELDSLKAFRSTFQGVEPGNDHEIMTRMAERHPFYNGTSYPRISAVF
jgi:uncharacterized SAM-binding protein YcdF (DUF218 family)